MPAGSDRNRTITLVASAQVLGGAERYATELYEGLAARGYKTRLIGSIPGWTARSGSTTPLDLGAKWTKQNFTRSLVRRSSSKRDVESAARVDLPAVFHCQYKKEQISLSSTLARVGPVIWTEHGRFRTSLASRALRVMYAAAARSADRIICVSEGVADDVAHIVRRSAVDVIVIENGVDTERYRPLDQLERQRRRQDRQPDIASSGGKVAWVGQMHSGKLPQLAVQVAQNSGLQFVMAGDGPLLAEIRSYEKSVENLNVLGFVEDPRPIYQSADVLLFTSTGKGEGLPKVIIEAAACGVPTVTHDGSGLGALAVASGGEVVADNPRLLAEALRSVIARKDAARLARNWAETLNTDQWVERHARALHGLA